MQRGMKYRKGKKVFKMCVNKKFKNGFNKTKQIGIAKMKAQKQLKIQIFCS